MAGYVPTPVRPFREYRRQASCSQSAVRPAVRSNGGMYVGVRSLVPRKEDTNPADLSGKILAPVVWECDAITENSLMLNRSGPRSCPLEIS
jgi:hypothetical protein